MKMFTQRLMMEKDKKKKKKPKAKLLYKDSSVSTLKHIIL